ncbi:MAG TPA: hypothetical protein VFV72_02575 [Candidatus Limnocylindrales bacterium]|nr:hypothetical protein [Candidatus Limnocylindrales bacterium]
MIDLFNGRPAEDILSRTVRVTLAGREYELAVLTIAGNKRWKASLDKRLTGMLNGLEALPDNDVGTIFNLLNSQVDALLDLLVEYDTTGVLPPRDVLEETVYESELLVAVREVWRAANPFAVASLEAATIALQPNDLSAPTSSPRPNGAGKRARSKRN